MRIKWRLKGFRELRQQPGVEADLDQRARRIAEAAGAGFDVLPAQMGRTRARRLVAPRTAKAISDNARHNTLIRSLDAGR